MSSDTNEQDGKQEWRRLKVAAAHAALGVSLLWLVHGAFRVTGAEPAAFGIFPRRVTGLVGIVLAPLLHGDTLHLFSNSVPLFVLITGLWLLYPNAAWRLLAAVAFLGGLLVWLFARPSHHIGASGINYGVVSFLFASGVIRREPPAIALALLVTFLYGGMIWGVLPLEPRVSHEAHLYSAIVGLLAAWFLRGFDRPPPISALRQAIEDDEDDDGEWRLHEPPDPR